MSVGDYRERLTAQIIGLAVIIIVAIIFKL